MPPLQVDLCVIGAGAGGLSVAAGAAQFGVNVALIERGKMGGDCLNYGCVPSKSLLAAARTAYLVRNAHRFGITTSAPVIDFGKLKNYIDHVIDTISVHDSVERFEKLGVKVIQHSAEFVNANTVRAGDTIIHARRFIVATGSSPIIPKIPGLLDVPFYTNETIFELTQKPEHLIVIGAGPIGCELAQAYLLLGCKVTLLEAQKMLPREEESLTAILRAELLKQGLDLIENIAIKQISQKNGTIEVTIIQNQQEKIVSGTHLLIATGRKANVNGLNLESAGIKFSPKGIEVNSHLRTSNRRVYAIGDVTPGPQFTHTAGYHAGIVLRNCLFRLPAKVNLLKIPAVTYTHPEIAHIGLMYKDAMQCHSDVQMVSWPLHDNDRAQAESETIGQINIVTNKKGHILGVSIISAHAGELLLPWILAMQEKKKLNSMASLIVPYPTFSEISKRAAGEFFKPLVFSPKIKRLIKFLQIFG